MRATPRFIGLLAALLVGCGGCTALKPWERGQLMQRCMQPDDPLLSAMDTHVHDTRESAQGASAEGGASCGCN